MDRSLTRSMRSSRTANNQDVSTVSEDRGKEILLRLLTQIVEFLERKEMMSSRVAASKEWRKSRSGRRSESNNNLFQVVIQVCEQRMRRLRRSTGVYDGQEWSSQSPRVLVAEAIVQELLVSLMELRVKEKETLVMDEVESVEIMRQLHVRLQKDEELVRTQVCVGAGDERQLEELQLMLRRDFLDEVSGVASPQKKQQMDSAASNEASLQFAWETIEDQKKEIIRLRAENDELKRLDSSSELQASFFDEEPAKVINLLRSQLSLRHDKNLDLLHDHIQRLEKALQTATASRAWDGSSFNSTRGDWSSLSRSTVGTDFSRTQIPRNKCEECRKSSASLIVLRSEVKQLRVQAEADEEALLQAEKDRGHLHRENSALSSALLSAKQKQEELRQMILNLTQEKHQLQNLGDSEQRTSERSIRVLQEQLHALEEQKAHLKRKFDDLVGQFDVEVSEKRAIAYKYNELEKTHATLTQSTTELKDQVKHLDEAARRCETTVIERDTAMKALQDQLDSKGKEAATRITELQEKEDAVAQLKDQIADLQQCLEDVEVEKRRSAGEIERLLQTLDECKKKNQRLEKGFEELKQGKELLASLQQVERGASALQLSELKQTREQLGAVRLELSATKAECDQLERAVSEANETSEDTQIQHDQEIKRIQHELKTSELKCARLEAQILEIESVKGENGQRIADLSQELAESKTAMLMWMSKYNLAREETQKLESNVESLSEEQYSLQQRIQELQADYDERDKRNENVKQEIASLKENQRVSERDRRVLDQEKKALVKLVQTLQARPELQQRAFREMLVTCQRGTERSFHQLSERVSFISGKLRAVEERYETLKAHVTKLKATQDQDSLSDDGCRVVPKPKSPEIVVQEEDFLSSSFAMSSSQPLWIESITKKTSSTEQSTAALKNHVKLWKWKFFVQCLVVNSSKRANVHLTNELKHVKLEMRQRLKLQHLHVLVVKRLSKKLLLSQQIQFFTNWKYQTQEKRLQTKLRARMNDPLQPSFAPTTTMALANCIQLVRKFCEPGRKMEKERSKTSGADELTGYLVEINTKVASWKVAVDRKVTEYAERNKQLKAVQRRCADLKDLVGLNQRLIEEMERRSASQQNVVEAAWDFASAYKALSPSARAQVFQSRAFLSASKGIVEGLNSLGLPRSVNKLSQTLGPKAEEKTGSLKKVNFLSASAGPSSSSVTEKSRKRLNDSNIELLEDAVGSLKGAMKKQQNLQLKLKEKERSLSVTTKELQKRNMQFLLLRSFLRWKCASSALFSHRHGQQSTNEQDLSTGR